MADEKMHEEQALEAPTGDDDSQQLSLPLTTATRPKPLDADSFRHHRATLLAPGLFTLNKPPERKKVLDGEDVQVYETKTFETVVTLPDNIRLTYTHPHLGPAEQRLLTGLMIYANGTQNGSDFGYSGAWMLGANDESEDSKYAWDKFGGNGKAFGNSMFTAQTTAAQLADMTKPNRSVRHVNQKERDRVIDSLNLLAQVKMKIEIQDENGGVNSYVAPLITEIKARASGKIMILANPLVAEAVVGKAGTYTLMALEPLKNINFSDAGILLHGRLCAQVDQGKTASFYEKRIVEYLWPSHRDEESLDKAKEEKRAQNRRRTIKKAFDDLASAGWSIHYEKGTKGGEHKWTVTRPFIGSNKSNRKPLTMDLPVSKPAGITPPAEPTADKKPAKARPKANKEKGA